MSMYQVRIRKLYRTLFQQTQYHHQNYCQLGLGCKPACLVFMRKFSNTRRCHGSAQLKSDIDLAYSVLGLDSDCSIAEIRNAYIELAKQYHPDSGSALADARKFTQIKEAYKSVLEREKNKDLRVDDPEDDPDKYYYDINHTAPQHRQYLNHEGIGFGSPSQREKQYNQYKVWRAASDIQEYRIQNLAQTTESALVLKDKKLAKKVKISNAIERIVEDLVQESMNQGDFENLAGSGKPLEYVDRNPHVDSATHNLNKILINNGYTPEWITLQSDIRKEITNAREKLAVLRSKIENGEYDDDCHKTWTKQLKTYTLTVRDVNELIDKYNLIVPFVKKQFAHYDASKDINKITENCGKYLPKTSEDIERIFSEEFLKPHQNKSYFEENISWNEVWTNIREVFSRKPNIQQN